MQRKWSTYKNTVGDDGIWGWSKGALGLVDRRRRGTRHGQIRAYLLVLFALVGQKQHLQPNTINIEVGLA